jgi:multicomponent Na+:H+ antiporter subunit D
MLLGGLGAVSMGSVRGILSVSIMSQVGYMVLAVGLGLALGITADNRELAVAGGVFFVVHNMVVKSSLFLCGGLMCRHTGGSDELSRMGGVARRAPWLAALFLVAALSLAGLPPFSGFFAKFVLIREAARAEQFVLAAVALLASVLTLLGMMKIWSYGFWSRPQSAPAGDAVRPRGVAFGMAGTSILVLASLAMGFGAEHVLRACQLAARVVVEPSAYVRAVLGPDQIRPIRATTGPSEEGVRR